MSVADHSAGLICIKNMKPMEVESDRLPPGPDFANYSIQQHVLDMLLDTLFGASAHVRRSSATTSRKKVSRHRSWT